MVESLALELSGDIPASNTNPYSASYADLKDVMANPTGNLPTTLSSAASGKIAGLINNGSSPQALLANVLLTNQQLALAVQQAAQNQEQEARLAAERNKEKTGLEAEINKQHFIPLDDLIAATEAEAKRKREPDGQAAELANDNSRTQFASLDLSSLNISGMQQHLSQGQMMDTASLGHTAPLQVATPQPQISQGIAA